MLGRSRAEATVVTLNDQTLGLTRFAHDVVHQNVEDAKTVLHIRAIAGERIGVASTTAFDDAAIDATAARACELAQYAPPDPLRARLDDLHPPSADASIAATYEASPQTRAHQAAQIFTVARESELWSAGYAMTSTSGVTIATSRGARASFDVTRAGVNVKMNATDATGFAEAHATDVGMIDTTAVARRAAAKAYATRAPQSVEPGEWTVILEPAAFGELLSYLIPHFSAQSVDEGESFLSEGARPQLDARVTLVDDVRDPLNPGAPFDADGSPTERVTLIDAGRPAEHVTDAYWSRRLGVRNTGHAPSSPADGPEPQHPIVAAGTKHVDELIAQTKRGLLVSRFWYIRNVDMRRTIVTGMTRDGTYLIEDGKLTGGVRNLRFNVSILDALAACEPASELVRTGGYSYGIVVPAVKIERFRFTSTTAF